MFFAFGTRMILLSIVAIIATVIYYVWDWLYNLKNDTTNVNERISRVAERRAKLYEAPEEPKVLTPFKLGNLTLRNRIIKAAANEHMDPETIISHHKEFADGGAAMSIVAYIGVTPDGCTFEDQYHLDFESTKTSANAVRCTETMQKLCNEVHKSGGAACAQITHAGNFSDPVMAKNKLMGPIREFVPKSMGFCSEMTKADMNRLTLAFTKTALWAKDVAGFDAIEVHCGHGYLLSQAVREAVGPDYPIIIKMNVEDGFENGCTLSDVSITGSGGHVGKNGLYMMKGDVPTWVMATSFGSHHWYMGVVIVLFQKWLIPVCRFFEAYFEKSSMSVLKSVKIPVGLLGGIFTLETMERALNEGFELIFSARALILEPDLVKKIGAKQWTFSPCTVCNRCLADQAGPIYCPLKGKPEEWY